jgi:pimeloyl-ACP methyl ester carboxylesterase
MTSASLRQLPSRLRRSLATALAPLAFATLVACGTNLTPTIAELSGREVEVVEAGEGDVTVVFESGLGNDWTPWDLVAGQVAGEARVFAYSRPGYGDSEPTEEPRDAAQIVEDLRDLLAARDVAPPYILVGHSFGGAYMELFAKTYPEEVVGLVLVDSRHRDFTVACQEAGLDGCTIPASAVSSLPQVQQDELNGFVSTSDQIQAAGEFGPFPVRVLTGTSHLGFTLKTETLWMSMHGSLAAEAADGDQIVFEGAGHYLQNERALEVADVILSLVEQSANLPYAQRQISEDIWAF